MTIKEQQEFEERLAKLFSQKIEEMVAEFGDHLHQHVDELEEMMEEGFVSLHEHIKIWERVDKMEKKIEQVEAVAKTKGYIT